MIAKIGNSLIKKLVPAEKVYDVRDTHLKGFLVRVHPSGNMSYICQYKRGRRINLGRVGVITAAQAREKAMEVLSNINKGIEPKEKIEDSRPKNLKEFIERLYEPWVLAHHKRGKKTLATLKRCFGKFFPKPLMEITPALLEQWRIKRLSDGISNATLNRDIGTLKSLLTKAIEWECLKENPIKNVRLSKLDRTPMVRYLSIEEEKRLRQALLERENQMKQARANANQWRSERDYTCLPEFGTNEFYDHLMPMVLLSINTGLRQGELFNLAWEMVNLIEKSIIMLGAVTKNGSSRFIPLNNEAFTIISNLYEKSSTKKGFVFPSKNNKPFNNIKRSWTALLKKAEITQFRWHDLRHHFASKLVMAGVDLNTVRELLGHSDIKMTLRYAHLAPEYKINAVRKIDWTL
jgi:site-specific recombinase XerD